MSQHDTQKMREFLSGLPAESLPACLQQVIDLFPVHDQQLNTVRRKRKAEELLAVCKPKKKFAANEGRVRKFLLSLSEDELSQNFLAVE